VAADAVIGGKPLSQLSSRELGRVVQSERDARSGPPPPEARAAWDAAAAAKKALRARGAKGATAEARRIANRWRIVIELAPDQVKLLLGR